MQIRNRDDPKYKGLKEKYEGWVLYEPTPWGVSCGLMTYMMNFDKLIEADPDELNNFLSSYCENSNMLMFGLTKRNQRQFASALEAMSYTFNTIVFNGDVFNEDIMNMADRRILYIRGGSKIIQGFYSEFTRNGDQIVFEIGDNTSFNTAVTVCRTYADLPPVYFIPKWQDENPERSIERSFYIYKYLTHSYRMIDAIRRADVNVHVGVDLRMLIDVAKDGDPLFLRMKAAKKAQDNLSEMMRKMTPEEFRRDFLNNPQDNDMNKRTTDLPSK